MRKLKTPDKMKNKNKYMSFEQKDKHDKFVPYFDFDSRKVFK